MVFNSAQYLVFFPIVVLLYFALCHHFTRVYFSHLFLCKKKSGTYFIHCGTPTAEVLHVSCDYVCEYALQLQYH